MDCELSEEHEAKVGMQQESLLSHFIIAVVIDVATETARGCAK